MPVEIDENWYIDGGTMNNFPVEPLTWQCDVMLGSFVSPKGAGKGGVDQYLQLLNRTSDLSFIAVSRAEVQASDLVFAPPELWKSRYFRYQKVDEIYQFGYEHACSKNGPAFGNSGAGGVRPKRVFPVDGVLVTPSGSLSIQPLRYSCAFVSAVKGSGSPRKSRIGWFWSWSTRTLPPMLVSKSERAAVFYQRFDAYRPGEKMVGEAFTLRRRQRCWC